MAGGGATRRPSVPGPVCVLPALVACSCLACSWLAWLLLAWTYWLASGRAPQAKPMPKSQVRCAECGGEMRVVDITFEPTGPLSEHALAYLDSG